MPGRRCWFGLLAAATMSGAAPLQEAAVSPRAGEAPAPLDARPAAALRAGLDSLMVRTGWRDVEWSVLAVSLDRRDTLLTRSPDQALAPASNIKLLTTAAAMVFLGPDYRFRTFLLADGPVVGGVLDGDLYLYGTGDPTLGQRFQAVPARPLIAFADTLVALGIREVRGDMVGDGSYFHGPGAGMGWVPDYLDVWYAAPAGALSVHENMVRLEIRPGAQPGWRPEIAFVPGGRGIAVVNLARTEGGGRVRARRFAYEAPIIVEGRIGSGTASFAVPVGDPARYAAALFRDVLEERGIVVRGRVRAIADPAESPLGGRRVFAPAFEPTRLRILGEHASVPLHEILEVINYVSHNFYADQVLRAVGRAATGEGSVAGGARAVAAILEAVSADTAGMRIYDGSGLSPMNRVSAAAFVALLDYMDRSPWAEAFRETLPAAGRAPRFRRMGGTAAEANLRAKTGTIDGVSSLSGYVTAANGERLAFSIIGNNLPSTAHAKYIENVIGIRLAEFHRPPR